MSKPSAATTVGFECTLNSKRLINKGSVITSYIKEHHNFSRAKNSNVAYNLKSIDNSKMENY